MDEKLEKYYENRFSMLITPGWKELIEDVTAMRDATDRLGGIKTEQDLHYKRGELSIINWLLGLESMTNDAFTGLTSENTD